VIDDSYDLRTPEQIELQYDLAGLGSRFLALAIDLLIQGAVVGALVAFFGLGGALLSMNFRDLFGPRSGVLLSVGVALLILLVFVLTWGYFLVFELIWNGQTPGKRVAGIRVLTDRGEPVTLVHTLVRNLLRLVDILPTSYTIGTISILVTRRGQRLGDLAAGTVVVRERRAELPRTLPPLDPALALPPQLARAFSPEDVRLARDFLLRAPSLPPARQRELGRQVAATLRARLQASGQPVPPDLADERLLPAVAALRA
jgi:uncharacterized RDD family membrane protein YckC